MALKRDMLSNGPFTALEAPESPTELPMEALYRNGQWTGIHGAAHWMKHMVVWDFFPTAAFMLLFLLRAADRTRRYSTSLATAGLANVHNCIFRGRTGLWD